MARVNPIDAMAEARARWDRSIWARGESFEKARASTLTLLQQIEDLVPDMLKAAELAAHPNPALLSKSRHVLGPRRVTLNHEGLVSGTVDWVRTRLNHPDLDLVSVKECLAMTLMIVNALSGRLEEPARRGNRTVLGGRKGSAIKRKERAIFKDVENEKIIRLVSVSQGKNPSLKSARSLAKALAPQMGIGRERLRKRIAELGLAPARPKSRKPKKMGQQAPS